VSINLRADYPRLEWDEENQLIIQAKQGSQYARDRLVECYMPFLIKMCFSFKPRDMLAEDFLGDAVIGFLKAIDTCKVNHPCRLSTYAKFKVSKAILRSQFQKRTINVPEMKRSRVRKLRQAEVRLFVDKGCVTIKALSKMTGFSTDEVKRLQHAQQFIDDLLSLDTETDTETSYLDLIPDNISEMGYERVNIQVDLEYFLSHLSKRERFIIERRSGIPKEMTNAEIGKIINLSEGRVGVAFNKAMRKMQRLARYLQGTPEQVQKAVNFPQVVMQGL